MWTTDIAGPAGAEALDYTDQGGGACCSLVAGVAALILSIEPDLTSEEVRHYLCRSAHDLGAPGRDEEYGWGRVDAWAALDMVLAKRADLNNDWKVDEQDLTLLTNATEAKDLSGDIAPAKRDGVVDAKDRELLTRYLGTEIPEFGLIAHWKLDETTGQIARDSAGSNHGTVVGSPTWQPTGGKLGGALQFHGDLGFVSTKSVWDPSQGPFSVFAWVKGGRPGQVIVSQVNGSVWFATDAAGALTTEVSGGRKMSLTSSAVITDGQWHRVGLVWDGATRALYVDDIEVARDAQFPIGGLAPSTGGLTIGANSKLTPGTFWSGLIDDVRIYNRAIKP